MQSKIIKSRFYLKVQYPIIEFRLKKKKIRRKKEEKEKKEKTEKNEINVRRSERRGMLVVLSNFVSQLFLFLHTAYSGIDHQ